MKRYSMDLPVREPLLSVGIWPGPRPGEDPGQVGLVLEVPAVCGVHTITISQPQLLGLWSSVDGPRPRKSTLRHGHFDARHGAYAT